MGHYSDPTASRALGGINREFSRQEKRAKRLCALLLDGKLTDDEFEAEAARFCGIYRHVLRHALCAAWKQREAAAEETKNHPSEKSDG